MNAPGMIGAFFDMDGTILPGPSLEWRFASYLDQSGLFNLPGWMLYAAKNVLRDPRGAVWRNKSYLAGLPETLAADWGRSLGSGPGGAASFPQACGAQEKSPLFPSALRRLAWHASRGHRIFFVSGTLAPLARAIAKNLTRALAFAGSSDVGGREQVSIQVCATELELRNGCWTGRLAGPQISGEAKARSLREAAHRYGLALRESYAYGNSFSDLAMLEISGHPVAANPSLRLARLARRRGWEISRWAESAQAEMFSVPKILNAKGAE